MMPPPSLGSYPLGFEFDIDTDPADGVTARKCVETVEAPIRDDPETEHGGRHDARQQLGKSASKSGFVANVSHHRRTHRPRRLPAGSAIYRGKPTFLN